MAKITLLLCDVKPCTLPAEREFEFNGEKIYVCGESCYVRFWSREYRSWKDSHYRMKTQLEFPDHVGVREAEQSEKKVSGGDVFRSDLHIVRAEKVPPAGI